MKLTNEQHEILKKYEKHLRRGYHGNYTYGLFAKDFDELLGIYNELGGKERLKYNCNVCCLRLTKFLGKLYFEWEPEQNPLPDEVVEAVLMEPAEEKPKKKRTAKKRTTKKTKKVKNEQKED